MGHDIMRLNIKLGVLSLHKITFHIKQFLLKFISNPIPLSRCILWTKDSFKWFCEERDGFKAWVVTKIGGLKEAVCRNEEKIHSVFSIQSVFIKQQLQVLLGPGQPKVADPDGTEGLGSQS